MRFYEFSTDAGLDKFILLLKNEIGSYSEKRSVAILNWANIAALAKKAGFEFLSDPKNGYETFKSIYDSSPIIQNLVKDFNDRGVELKVPGAIEKQGSGTQDSQAAVDKMAASAAPQQLAAQA